MKGALNKHKYFFMNDDKEIEIISLIIRQLKIMPKIVLKLKYTKKNKNIQFKKILFYFLFFFKFQLIIKICYI